MSVTLQCQAISPTQFILELRHAGQKQESLRLDLLAWDSDLLDRRCARLSEISETPTHQSTNYSPIVTELQKFGLEYVTVRVPQGDWLRIAAFERAGFEMLDAIVGYSKNCKAKAQLSSQKLRLATAHDADSIAQIALSAFRFSRFHNDPLLTPAQAHRVHQEWARNSVNLSRAGEQAVWIAQAGSKIAGFVSGKIATKDSLKQGTIDLIAVEESHAGQGVGSALCEQVENWFVEQQCRTSYVQTQSNNFAAMRLYSKCGYAASKSAVTLRWSSRELGA